MKANSCKYLLVAFVGTLLVLSPVSAKLGDSSLPPKKRVPKKVLEGRTPIPLPLPEKLLSKKQPSTKRNGPFTRIVGGEQVSGPGVYPFFVSWDGMCGGSLIHSDIVVTAAHCGEITASGVTVNAYELDNPLTAGAKIRSISERVTHPLYNTITVAYDVMVLKLLQPVTSFDPIQINTDSSVPSAGQDLTVIGMGLTSEDGFQADFLREVTVPAVSDRECNEAYFGEILDDVMLCAGEEDGGKDSCQGDSGGPIFSKTPSGDVDKLVGVVSWGFGCAVPGVPGVYAEISGVSDWIFAQICALSDDKPDDCPDPTPPPTPTPPGPGETTITVKITTDPYPMETSWEIADEGGDVVESAAQGSYMLSSHDYDTPVNLKLNKTYTFTIFDSYGDGLCCGGFYELRTASSALIASGNTFGLEESTTFVVPDANWIPTAPPSPEGGVPITISITTDQFPWETSWDLFDNQGNLVDYSPQGSYMEDLYLYSTTLVVDNETQYVFRISDSAGDGLCCMYGNGSYVVTTPGDNTNDTVILAQGGDFDEFETSTFIAGGGGSTPPPTPSPPPTTPAPGSQCSDTGGTINVDSTIGGQPCSWLGSNLDEYGYLCQFVDVARVCPSTCDSCYLFFCEEYYDDDYADYVDYKDDDNGFIP